MTKEEEITQLKVDLADVKAHQHDAATCPLNKAVDRLENTQHKVTWGLMALVAALVGKESLFQLSQHTPNLDRANFLLTAYVFGGLTIFLLYRALRRIESTRPLIAIAAMSVMVAGLLRLSLGFELMTARTSLFVAIPFTLAGGLALVERYLIGRKK